MRSLGPFWTRGGRKIRSHSRAEHAVIRQLLDEGHEVWNNGWPDLVALRDGKIRFIEIKRDDQAQGYLKPRQRAISSILEKYLGITVEVLRPSELLGGGAQRQGGIRPRIPPRAISPEASGLSERRGLEERRPAATQDLPTSTLERAVDELTEPLPPRPSVPPARSPSSPKELPPAPSAPRSASTPP